MYFDRKLPLNQTVVEPVVDNPKPEEYELLPIMNTAAETGESGVPDQQMTGIIGTQLNVVAGESNNTEVETHNNSNTGTNPETTNEDGGGTMTMTVDDVISEMSRNSADTADEDETTAPTGTKGFLSNMKERVVTVTKSGRSVRSQVDSVFFQFCHK